MVSHPHPLTEPVCDRSPAHSTPGLPAKSPPLAPPIPDYLQRIYAWAYLDPRNVAWLDCGLVVDAILFGNQGRLRRSAFREHLERRRRPARSSG